MSILFNPNNYATIPTPTPPVKTTQNPPSHYSIVPVGRREQPRELDGITREEREYFTQFFEKADIDQKGYLSGWF